MTMILPNRLGIILVLGGLSCLCVMIVHHFLLLRYVENRHSSTKTNLGIQDLSVLKLPIEGKEGFVSMGGTALERVLEHLRMGT